MQMMWLEITWWPVVSTCSVFIKIFCLRQYAAASLNTWLSANIMLPHILFLITSALLKRRVRSDTGKIIIRNVTDLNASHTVYLINSQIYGCMVLCCNLE